MIKNAVNQFHIHWRQRLCRDTEIYKKKNVKSYNVSFNCNDIFNDTTDLVLKSFVADEYNIRKWRNNVVLEQEGDHAWIISLFLKIY